MGAWNILELPLLAARSSKMETTRIAGKTWQSSHEPPHPREDTMESSGEGGRGKNPLKRSTQNVPSSHHIHKYSCKLYNPKHKESHVYGYTTRPLTTIERSRSYSSCWLLKLNLHLTSFNNCIGMWRLSAWDIHWQPAPSWRLQQWWAKPDYPAMSPNAQLEALQASRAHGPTNQSPNPRPIKLARWCAW